MNAILLSRDGFWTERVIDGAPPRYFVPWVRPFSGALFPAEESEFMPSHGMIRFVRIALDPVHNVAVYRHVVEP